jgi:NEDD4-binding protein 2
MTENTENEIIIQKTLYILRGISGSGKSYLSKQIIKEHDGKGEIFSTDDYFMKDGKYVFDGKKLGIAHDWNQKRSFEAMKKGITPIIIDNTNTCKWEGIIFNFNVSQTLCYRRIKI